jgi:hypothetical protein
MSFEKFFKRIKDTVYFEGDSLEIFIPTRYESHGCLDMTNVVRTLAIFDMKINGSIDTGYMLPAKITIEPNDIEVVMINGNRFAKLTLTKGDVFMKNTNVIRDSQLAYIVFYEMVYGGRTPNFIDYNQNAFVFDEVTRITGVTFPTDHAIFEMMSAMLHRSQDDISVQYRLTDMKKPARNIPLSLVSHAAISTTSKIVGAYMDDGIDASLVNASDVPSEIEDLLRQ